jgi:hypothetical protein
MAKGLALDLTMIITADVSHVKRELRSVEAGITRRGEPSIDAVARELGVTSQPTARDHWEIPDAILRLRRRKGPAKK